MALINLSANKDVALKMIKLSDSDKLVNTLWSMIVNKVYPSADPACMILSNMTIEKVSCVNVYEILTKNKVSMSKIIGRAHDMFSRIFRIRITNLQIVPTNITQYLFS